MKDLKLVVSKFSEAEKEISLVRQQHGNQVSEPEWPPGPRTIVCRLRNRKQKEEILRKARREKPDGLFISEDLSPETLAKRVSYVAALKEAKKAGKVVYFVLDRLVIKDN